jgi:hypothetical protein
VFLVDLSLAHSWKFNVCPIARLYRVNSTGYARAVMSGIAEVNGIGVDGSGNAFFSPWTISKAFKYTVATGLVTPLAGTGVEAFTGMGGPALEGDVKHITLGVVGKKGEAYFGAGGAIVVVEAAGDPYD